MDGSCSFTPKTSAERLLFDITHCCIRVKLFNETYDVFRTDDEAITIVRIDSSGSHSLTIPADGTTHRAEEHWKENIPLLLRSGEGTMDNLTAITNEYQSALESVKQSYFRSTWFDDADDSLSNIATNNGAILFERFFTEDNQWSVCPLNRLRGGRFSKLEKMENKRIILSPTHLPSTKDPVRDGKPLLGPENPLYAHLCKMCNQPNSIDSGKLCFYQSLNEALVILHSAPLPDIKVQKTQSSAIHSAFEQVIDWLTKTEYSLCFPIGHLLASSLRASYIMENGIDTGTKQVKFPQRGFKDTSSDENDILREEDRNAKLFLLVISVYVGSVCILSQKSHNIPMSPLSEKALSNASVHRAIDYLKGERQLFRHQMEGLEWSLHMEQTNCGGFIASDMGMGKTVQILLLHLCYEPEYRGRTLVVVPSGLLRQPWYKEATDSRYWGHGNLPFGEPLLFVRSKGKRKNFPSNDDIEAAQLVITSYNTLSSNPTLKQVSFRRVILDESTYIKNTAAQRSLAVRSVRCDMKWCLSGTPIENKKEDYLGQLLFLRISPYYHQDWWYERFESDRHRMFYSTMFKRNFQNIIDASLIEHPPISLEMNEQETEAYNKEKDKLLRFVLGSSDVSSQGQTIMKLLRLCRCQRKVDTLKAMINELLSPTKVFLDKFHEAHYKHKLLSTMLENSAHALEGIRNGHIVPTRNSISQYLDTVKDTKEDKLCDLEEIELFETMFLLQVESKLKNNVYNWKYVQFGTKKAVKQSDTNSCSDFSSDSSDEPLLYFNPEEKQQNDLIKMNNREICSGEKCVVFVQGADRAKQIGNELEQYCKKTVLVRPSATEKGADDIISRFQKDPTACTLVLTYRGGAHGLNLQVARNIFLLDPDWNPAILMQAIARCYRIGQRQDVHVYTFVTANSLEDRVQQVINKKMNIFRENISGVGEDITHWDDIRCILESSLEVRD